MMTIVILASMWLCSFPLWSLLLVLFLTSIDVKIQKSVRTAKRIEVKIFYDKEVDKESL